MKTDLGTTPVPEDQYRADVELLTQYQSYSAEIIRLSLLGIAGLAFFLVNLAASKDAPVQMRDAWAGLCLGISSLLFIMATACALSHRYHSADGLHYHIKAIRLARVPDNGAEVKSASDTRNQIYSTAGRWLAASVSLFGAGGFFFVFGFARLVYLWVVSNA